MAEGPKMIESFSEKTTEAIKMSRDLLKYIEKRSNHDLVLAIRSVSYAIGRLVADLPVHYREQTFMAILRDARETEKVLKSAGLDGRAVGVGEDKTTKKKTNLW